METIQLDDFLSDGIIKEQEFRNQVKTINWESFKDKQVMIKVVLVYLFQHGHI